MAARPHLSNICLTNRKQTVMGIETHRSGSLGYSFPSRLVRSAQPWPSGNQIQSAHTAWLRCDNILEQKTDTQKG